MKNILLAITIITTLLTSCKKKEETSTPANATSTSDPNTFIGVFISGTYTNNISGTTNIGYGATARFYNQPSSNIYGANEINVNNLSVNNYTLTNNNMFVYALISPPSNINLTSDTWSVTGASGIPSFSSTNNHSFPNCDDFNVIPDSVSKTAGYSFNISNVSNMTWGVVSFGVGSSAMTYTLSLGSNQINITPTQLAAMPIDTLGSINIQMQNAVTTTISGKNFRFIKEAQIIKRFKIKP